MRLKNCSLEREIGAACSHSGLCLRLRRLFDRLAVHCSGLRAYLGNAAGTVAMMEALQDQSTVLLGWDLRLTDGNNGTVGLMNDMETVD